MTLVRAGKGSSSPFHEGRTQAGNRGSWWRWPGWRDRHLPSQVMPSASRRGALANSSLEVGPLGRLGGSVVGRLPPAQGVTLGPSIESPQGACLALCLGLCLSLSLMNK